MKIIGLANLSGPAYHRVMLPLINMKETDVYITNDINEKIIEEKQPDILFYNRMLNEKIYDKILFWRKTYGFKLVVDFDDYWYLDTHHILYPDYINDGIPEKMIKHIQNADLVTCTNERLKLAISQLNKNVEVFPNAIPKGGQFAIETEPSELIRLFWAGSNTHQRDIEILRNPMKRISSDTNLSQKISMVMAGYTKGYPAWDEMIQAYTSGLKIKGNLIEGKPVDEYYKVYEQADIAIIPLKQTLFNGYKSNLKILEAANMGIPVIVSKVNPYLDFPDDCVCYVEHQKDWYKWIKKLVNDEEERRARGYWLKEYCDHVFNFEEINNKRKETFAQLVKNNIYSYETV